MRFKNNTDISDEVLKSQLESVANGICDLDNVLVIVGSCKRSYKGRCFSNKKDKIYYIKDGKVVCYKGIIKVYTPTDPKLYQNGYEVRLKTEFYGEYKKCTVSNRLALILLIFLHELGHLKQSRNKSKKQFEFKCDKLAYDVGREIKLFVEVKDENS